MINDRRTTSRQVDKSTRVERYRATVELNRSRVNDQLVRPPDLVTTEMSKIILTDRMMYSMILQLEDRVKPNLIHKVKVKVEFEVRVNNDQVLVRIDQKTTIPSNSATDEVKKNPIEAMTVIRI